MWMSPKAWTKASRRGAVPGDRTLFQKLFTAGHTFVCVIESAFNFNCIVTPTNKTGALYPAIASCFYIFNHQRTSFLICKITSMIFVKSFPLPLREIFSATPTGKISPRRVAFQPKKRMVMAVKPTSPIRLKYANNTINPTKKPFTHTPRCEEMFAVIYWFCRNDRVFLWLLGDGCGITLQLSWVLVALHGHCGVSLSFLVGSESLTRGGSYCNIAQKKYIWLV